MRYRQTLPDLAGGVEADFKLLEGVHVGAMTDLVSGFKAELKALTFNAGLGNRLANTWRGVVYPGGQGSLHPSGYVYSAAPKIVGAFAHGATIVPLDGRRYLAIPTRNVPSKGRGKLMTPVEVEALYNQDLIIRQGRAGRRLAFVNAIRARNQRGFRPATAGRLSQGRATTLVLMFTLTPVVRLPKRLDADGAFSRWSTKYDGLVQSRYEASALGRTR